MSSLPKVTDFFTQLFTSPKKLISIITSICILAICILGGTEIYVRSKVGKCISRNLGEEIQASSSVSLGFLPMFIAYLSGNQQYVGISAHDVYQRDGLNIKIDAHDTNIETGISQRVNVHARWSVQKLGDQLKKSLHDNSIVQEISVLAPVDIEVHSRNEQHALVVNFISSAMGNSPLVTLVIVPTVKNNSVYYKVIKTDINVLGFSLPTSISQGLVDTVEETMGSQLTPKIPAGFSYTSVNLEKDTIFAELVSRNYPPTEVVGSSKDQPKNIAKICAIV